MKKISALCLALIMVLSLCACGESAELKSVREQIAAIGEVSLDSEAAITAAEEAYRALSDEEKAKVGNYAELLAARETLEEAKKAAEIEAARKALVGEWTEVYSTFLYNYSAEDFVFAEDGTVSTGNLSIEWGLSEDGGSVEFKFGDTIALSYDIVDYNGITALVNSQSDAVSSVFVRPEDYQRFVDQRFVAVEINSENIGDYIGEYVRIGRRLDEFGEPREDGGVCMFRSRAYEQGLVYVGSSADFVFEYSFHGNRGEYTFSSRDPFLLGEEYTDAVFQSFGRAKGTLYYVKAEYVAENSVENMNGFMTRVVRLTDGTKFVDNIITIRWDETDADYNDWRF